SNKEPFSIILPPPNVTGKLHLGHAWDVTLQDILIRYKKMCGFETMWVPGMDHAGIATQAKVDEKLKTQGLSRFQIGREKFTQEAWQWKEEHASLIRDQWSKLGLALDYSQEKFTLDDDVNRSVVKVFVELYNRGLIYRGNRITNWDPVAMTAISDIEVIHKELEGKLYYFKYFFKDSDDYLEVATTRPETMFGDVAVAINPSDKRAEKLKGKMLKIPLVDRYIPIILDEYADPEYGSGVVKVTPAHDPNDFQIGQRHDLEQLIVMNLDGSMNSHCGKYNNIDRHLCRKEYVEELEQKDLLSKIETINHSVGHSERTGAIVEPILSKQWYVKMQPLAKKALEFQETDEKIEFFPPRFEKTFGRWMDDIQDWCISRQLWWGHQIPVWYHNDTKEVYVGEEAPVDIVNWTRDEDVLDTWFSSALWPFSATIWADKPAEMEKFFPTDVLVTGYDIIFFWVSRMIFQSLHFTKEKPFNEVLIHGLIRASDGRKMSKSLGNGIDPMDIIESHGADSLRLFLTTNSAPGQDLRFSEEKLDSSWNFLNKLWNISRFVMMNAEGIEGTLDLNKSLFDSADHFIINQLNNTIKTVNNNLDKYEFGEASKALHSFIWDDFASWYLEISKANLLGDDPDLKFIKQNILMVVLKDIIKMLHPFTPFITDDIYLALTSRETIFNSSWPIEKPNIVEVEKSQLFEKIQEMIVGIRNVRAENDIKPSLELDILLQSNVKLPINDLEIIKNIGRLSNISFVDHVKEDVISFVIEGFNIHIISNGIIDLEAKLNALIEQANKFQNEITRSVQMLSNENFVSRAPQNKLDEEKQKAQGYIDAYNEVEELINEFDYNHPKYTDVVKLKKILGEIWNG
ncbi:MAG: valine--tRNA ligase, partial [Spiroplasma sp.]|nr:valine--tRNA ligase [Mycoplasmatales bacterium]